MNEDSGTAYDSTANRLDGIPSKGTNELADISQMVAYENGACGRARVNGNVNMEDGQKMIIPSYDALQLGSTFVFSGWFFINDIIYKTLFLRGIFYENTKKSRTFRYAQAIGKVLHC